MIALLECTHFAAWRQAWSSWLQCGKPLPGPAAMEDCSHGVVQAMATRNSQAQEFLMEKARFIIWR